MPRGGARNGSGPKPLTLAQELWIARACADAEMAQQKRTALVKAYGRDGAAQIARAHKTLRATPPEQRAVRNPEARPEERIFAADRIEDMLGDVAANVCVADKEHGDDEEMERRRVPIRNALGRRNKGEKTRAQIHAVVAARAEAKFDRRVSARMVRMARQSMAKLERRLGPLEDNDADDEE
jgi:hypothetical protein